MSDEGITRLEKLEARNRRLRAEISALKWREIELKRVFTKARAAIRNPLGTSTEGA